MRAFYTLLFYLLLPFAFVRLWLRGRKLPAYRQRWRERFGFCPRIQSDKEVLWFHTVSVGEFIAARPLIEHYVKQQRYEILVTTMTPTGSERVRAAFGERVKHCYLPYDLPGASRRFLERSQAKIFVCLETELWPNLIHACHKRGIKIMVANARLSQRSARGYKMLRNLSRRMLKKIDVAAIQNEGDAGRFVSLGLKPERAHVIGNIKFDLNISDTARSAAAELKQQLTAQGEQILIAASTHKGEDEIILSAFKQLRQQHKHLKLILVPRHPERFDAVYKLCLASGYSVARRSDMQTQAADILLGDTMGELLIMLGASDFAFIGGSFIDNGGHNYIEPAAWSLPIVSGPSTYNFRTIAEELQQAKALLIVDDEQQLSKALEQLLEKPDAALAQGRAALAVAEKNRGALDKLIALIDKQLSAL
ncbi:lipid IV(A) 3-deoxy-D-manno-octulosonic acid transferase [Agaribacterium haliotis]|uniref:lipid IV(A) 3-deoxy-D-manno-octulosonic acid transferase n=1 Tax=Agaribacterium haliotis TaxID=2013869 RepID=UPI000BB52D39|nr:lipid IV(A) 3-deoxy-D-manno-octulosonic acid transferase [Agaribacterium haliotis]